MSERARFRLLLLGVGSLGLLLMMPPWETWLPTHEHPILAGLQRLLEGTGEAFVVAAILAVVVDEAAKRDLLKEFTESISSHIVGRLLQPELREHIEQYLKADLVRNTWTITYTLSEVPGHPLHKRLLTTFAYEMENRSSTPKDYLCAYDLEESLLPHIGTASILKVKGTNLVDGNGDFHFPDSTRPTWEPVTTKDGTIRFREPFTIAARPNMTTFKFEVESEEYLPDGSIVPFFAKYPVLNTTLTVHYPVHTMKVIVELSLGDVPNPALLDHGEGERWTFDKPMLPGQGFTIRFASRPPVVHGGGSVQTHGVAVPVPVASGSTVGSTVPTPTRKASS
jgi:hypothetical protein